MSREKTVLSPGKILSLVPDCWAGAGWEGLDGMAGLAWMGAGAALRRWGGGGGGRGCSYKKTGVGIG